MKLKELYEELLKIAKDVGITVRRGKGNFKGGYCIVHEKDLIVLNSNASLETMASVVAKSLLERDIDNVYIKPVVRDFIERERDLALFDKQYKLEVTE
ncbi:MAG: hypothetical protein WCT77_12240 [Bacteroidota bacterium]